MGNRQEQHMGRYKAFKKIAKRFEKQSKRHPDRNRRGEYRHWATHFRECSTLAIERARGEA